jgi:SAM-dependent methyltransferase
MFEAIQALHARYSNVRAWAQTDPKAGMDLFAIRECLGLNDVIGLPIAPPIGTLPQHAVRDMYSAFDVLLQGSTTEGFGLPVVEAQANGCPVVLNACTSIAELCGPGGMPAQPLGHAWLETGTRLSVPNVNELTNALMAQYRQWEFHRGENRSGGRVRWAQQFDWDWVYDQYWRPLLESVPARVEPEKHAERKLQLGCGNNPHSGFVHHDLYRHSEHVDVAHDLTTFPWPWPDSSQDYIVAEDVFEHLRGELPEVFNELHRILAPGGYLFIRTCEAGSWMHAYDPTHVRGFALNSFNYWDPDTLEGKAYGMEAGERKWKIVRKSLHGLGEIEVLMQPRKPAAVSVETEIRELVAAD